MKDMPEKYLSILNHLATVLDNLPEQVALIARDGNTYRLLLANSAFVKQNGGASQAEHPGFHELLNPQQYRRFEDEAATTTASRDTQTFRHDNPDGSVQYATYLPILDALGEATSIVLLITDTTALEQQKSEIDRLISSLATWRETPGELLLELDEHGVITFCSTGVLKRFGLPAQKWVGQQFTDIASCRKQPPRSQVAGRTHNTDATIADEHGEAVAVRCELWRVGDSQPTGPTGVRLTVI